MEEQRNIGKEKNSRESHTTDVELRRKMKTRWGKLSNEQLDSIQENNHILAEQLVKTYGFSKDFARSESETFLKSISPERQENSSNFGSAKSSVPRMSGRMNADHTQDDERSPYFDDQL